MNVGNVFQSECVINHAISFFQFLFRKAISTTAEKNFLSNQFKNEGAELAAEEKFYEAIEKYDETTITQVTTNWDYHRWCAK